MHIRSVTFHCTIEHPDHSLWFDWEGTCYTERDHEHRAFSLRMWLLPLLSYCHFVYIALSHSLSLCLYIYMYIYIYIYLYIYIYVYIHMYTDIDM